MKKLTSKPNHRSVHKVRTPNLGGIGIFITINLIITFLGNYFDDQNLFSVLGATTLLFFLGLMDDLIELKAKQKILGQIVAVVAIIVMTGVRIENLYGLFGINELYYSVSIALTVFMYILFINAYNLIDGVDGLAGSYAITITSFFGVFYFFNRNDSMFFLCLSLVGALISFLIFNFSKKEKIFMGDTGSMIVGFLLSYFAISFLSVSFNPEFLIQNVKAPVFVLALFSFPLIDTLRVFMLRLMKRKSPFTADKNHIHHVLLKSGLQPWKISVLVSVFSSLVVFGVFIFNDLTLNKQTILLFSFWVISVIVIQNLYLSNKLKKKSKKSKKRVLTVEKPEVKTIRLSDLA
ncbi:MraY family glycosyltransferase [Polaribacter ponticola]|uniref:MraY family glycosyltransferase n=1 Tax=Polaribacter ponticola TaxID=2978475 RepID=A0ABT5SA23_9FLAO|nr:MraY family glycosyltransferase [Polaribacter sp. MSW5]MDD7914966.1 MraY family glycosyltransferase [Polaribacter sp. MSW5]